MALWCFYARDSKELIDRTHPEEIAFSILAQVIAVRRAGARLVILDKAH